MTGLRMIFLTWDGIVGSRPIDQMVIGHRAISRESGAPLARPDAPAARADGPLADSGHDDPIGRRRTAPVSTRWKMGGVPTPPIFHDLFPTHGCWSVKPRLY